MIARGPLQGVRVMDFGWVMAGPRAGKALADLGAEVIRIEGRDRLDTFRGAGAYAGGKPTAPGGRFKETNRNKLGITLNMRDPRGLEIATRLLRVSDVVIENFSAGVLDRWGFGYPVMKVVKPDIIYASLAGFGQTGPYRGYVSHGPVLQAMAGYTHCTGLPGRAPVVMGAYADFVAGLSAALAVLMALAYRQRTGRGQHIDLGQYQAITALMGTAVLDYSVNGRAAQPIGAVNYHLSVAPYGTYRCAGDDRWCVITVLTDEQWQAFCRGLGSPAWTADPTFASASARVEHRAALDRHVTEWTVQHTPEQVMYLLQKVGVPAAAVQNAADLARDPHLHARGFWERARDPDLGAQVFEGIPEKLSETPGHVWRPAPQVGEHNAYVYGTLLGMSAEEIERCRTEGVI